MSLLPHPEYMCITTLISNDTNVSEDACWDDVVKDADEANVIYLGNITACILNVPEDLRIELLSELDDRFGESHINCFVRYNSVESWQYVWGMGLLAILFLSMLCLLLTVVSYAIKGELFSLPGLNLACLCGSHFVHYLTGILSLFNLPHYQVNEHTCVFFGFTRNFTILATFFWLNVMAFDIWKTIHAMDTRTPSERKRFKARRFLKYSAYAWGMALTIALTAVIFDQIPNISESFRPSYQRPHLKDPDIR